MPEITDPITCERHGVAITFKSCLNRMTINKAARGGSFCGCSKKNCEQGASIKAMCPDYQMVKDKKQNYVSPEQRLKIKAECWRASVLNYKQGHIAN